VLVMAFVVVAIMRRNRAGSNQPLVSPPIHLELRKGIIVAACVVLTTLILFVFLAADFLTGRAIDSEADAESLTIKVTGQQWWWQVEYADPTASNIVTTANEIHIPVGRSIRFELMSSDVIHSFWVPNLHGKTDMIPGHPTRTFLRVNQDRAGKRFWGQCAEFCGHQHANMRFQVIAEMEDDFQRWLEHQRQDAPEPATALQKRGRDVFLTRQCVICHTIGSTLAQARVGPDLTHMAGRSRIAAGTLANNRGNLAGWITDAQSIKPGVRMPPNPLASEELHALLGYLETLK
jgi:cytochrome c oxidase subunit II